MEYWKIKAAEDPPLAQADGIRLVDSISNRMLNKLYQCRISIMVGSSISNGQKLARSRIHAFTKTK